MKILLGNFKAKFGRKNIFKLAAGDESLHQNSNEMVLEQYILSNQKI
jgi:hypothetical protein